MPRRRNLVRYRWILILAATLVAAVGYVLAASWWQAEGTRAARFSELLIPRAIDVATVVWLFWVGSSIGSFLNVVAWRMPQGMSINGRSRCPRCRTQLKWQDNFPVFGWLALGGRCRTCRLPISVRYPVVEAAVGLSITLVGFAELHRMCLPFQTTQAYRGPLWTPALDLAVIATAAYHIAALSVAWAFGLILLDRRRLPGRLLAAGLAIAIVPMLVYPTLMVVPWQVSAPPDWRGDWLYLDAVLRVVTALAAAAIFGRSLAAGLCPSADPKHDPLGRGTAQLMDLIAALILPAVIVGWQALPAVLLIASLLGWLVQRVLPKSRSEEPLTLPEEPSTGSVCPAEPGERGQEQGLSGRAGERGHEGSPRDALGSFTLAIPAAMTLQIIFWRFFHHWIIWPSVGSPPAVILVAAGLALCIPLWLHQRPSARSKWQTASGEEV